VVVANATFTFAKGAAITTAKLLANVVSRAAQQGLAVARNPVTAAPATIESSMTLRDAFLRAKAAHFATSSRSAMSTVEATKVAALAAFAETPFIVGDGARMEVHVRALTTATTLDAANAAQQHLLSELSSAHGQMHATAILTATERAFMRVGFSAIQQSPTIGSPNRLEAMAGDGRVVVAEVAPDGTTTTEILGGCGAEQEALHDRIEAALEAEGIRASNRSRKPTGGVASTQTAREFLRRKVSAKNTAAERTRRLNQQTQARRR